MSDKKKTIKDQAEDIRRDLDSLIGNDTESIEEMVDTDPKLLPAKERELLPSF